MGLFFARSIKLKKDDQFVKIPGNQRVKKLILGIVFKAALLIYRFVKIRATSGSVATKQIEPPERTTLDKK